MDTWVWWFVAAVVLVIAEVFTGTFVMLMLAVGAFVAALAGAAGAGPLLQVLTFAVVSTLTLSVARKPLKDYFYRRSHKVAFGVEAIIGSSAMVMDRVEAESGQVRIGGELWRARPAVGGEVFEPGQRVRVVQIQGATALVGRDSE